MFCRECRNPIPDGLLACPRCTVARSTAALWHFQLDPLRKLLSNNEALKTRLQAGKRHIQMIGAERAFCGEDLHRGARRGWLHLSPWPNLNPFCDRCTEALNRAIQEARDR